jgi:sec-independent protein translocase protein TatA
MPGATSDARHFLTLTLAFMGEFSPLHWLLVIAIALLLFGTAKFAAVGKGLGEGIRNFKSAMKEPEDPKKEKEKEEEKKS